MKSRDGLIRLKRFQVREKRRQVAQIEAMIAEFERMAKDLNDQVVAEQERSGIKDTSHFAYPTFAKAAIQRRDNLLASVEELKGQLARGRGRMHRGGAGARKDRGDRRARPGAGLARSRRRPERRGALTYSIRPRSMWPARSAGSERHAVPQFRGVDP